MKPKYLEPTTLIHPGIFPLTALLLLCYFSLTSIIGSWEFDTITDCLTLIFIFAICRSLISCPKQLALIGISGIPLVCIIPYAGTFLMGGDWWQHLGMAMAVSERRFDGTMLARSPFFAAGAFSFIRLFGPLAGFQIYCSMVNISCFAALTSLECFSLRRKLLLSGLLCFSPHFLLLGQNLWPKYLASTCLFLGCMLLHSGLRIQERPKIRWGMFFIASSVNAHESSALFFPVLLAILWINYRNSKGRMLGYIIEGLGLAIILCGIWQIWTILAFGLDARINQNPAVTFAAPVGYLEKFLGNIRGVFWAWPWNDILLHWQSMERKWQEVLNLSYYTFVSIYTWSGATFATTLMPLFLWRKYRKPKLENNRPERIPAKIGAAIIISVIMYCLVLGESPRYGAVQGGLTPIVVAFYYYHARMHVVDSKSDRVIAAYTLCLGIIPYTVIAYSMSILIHGPDPIANWAHNILFAKDADYYCTRVEQLRPIVDCLGIWGTTIMFFLIIAISAQWFISIFQHTPDSESAEPANQLN